MGVVPPVPSDEEARLRALQAFNILDTAPEEAFDDLTRVAAAICETPISTVSIVDRDRQWFKSMVGLDEREHAREVSFCAHTLAEKKQLVVPDALEDPRFASNPLVLGDPWIRFYAGAPLVTDEGHVLGTICVLDRVPRELTPTQLDALDALARQTMRALETRRQALRLQELGDLVDLAREAIIVRHVDGRIVLWNNGAVALYGHEADAVRGAITHELLQTEFPEPLEEINRKLERDGIWQGTLRHRTGNGETVVVDSRWAMHRLDEAHATVLEINTDVTERTRLTEERERVHAMEREAARTLSEQNATLREIDRIKDEFVALVSHELRTPLASIRGYLEVLLQEETGPLNEEQRRFLEIVDRNGVRLHGIVDDLLVLASVQAGKLQLSREQVDLPAVAAETLEMIAPAAADKGVELRSELDGQLLVDADRARVGQVFANLVSNAVKFTPAGGRVTIRSGADDGMVFVEVCDTGMGIPEQELPHLFGRFYRTSDASEQAIPGTGLGLAISRAIAEAHGGALEVAETSPQGTTFRLTLPTEP